MADLALQERHVAAILDGSKPFTLRRAWRNTRTPDLGARIRFVVRPRSPQRQVVASAIVQFRTTVVFTEERLIGMSSMRLWERIGIGAAADDSKITVELDTQPFAE